MIIHRSEFKVPFWRPIFHSPLHASSLHSSAMLASFARVRVSSVASWRGSSLLSQPKAVKCKKARASRIPQRSLMLDSRRGNSALFSQPSKAGAKTSLMERIQRSNVVRHGGHGPHHDRYHRLLSGVHADVDPRLYNQKAQEDLESGTKVTIYGLIMNIALSGGKAVAGILGNSTAMLADAVHSLGDLASDVVTLYTYKISAKGPSPSYPYGYGRFDSLGGLIVSLLLVGTGVGIGYHALVELFTAAGDAPPTSIALYAAAISVLVKEVLFQVTLRTANQVKSNVLVANAWHHRSDAISSGLAFLGIGGEILGVPHMDALAGIAVAGIIVKAALPVIRDSVDEITDRNDFVQVEVAIRELATSMSIKVDRLRIRKSGNRLVAEISIIVDPGDCHQFLERTRAFKTHIREQFPIVQDISVELQEKGMEEFHPEHGTHPPGQEPDFASAHQQVQRESKKIFPAVNG